MPAGEYEFLHEDELWDSFLDLWNRLGEPERRRITQAYQVFCARFGAQGQHMEYDDHPSLPGVQVMTVEPLRFHFEVDHEGRAVFLLNIFYVQPTPE